MKIIISQQHKKLLIEFYSDAPTRSVGGRSPDLSVGVDKADGFINALDRFSKKHKIKSIGQIGSIRRIGPMGVLTERIIRAIIAGLSF